MAESENFYFVARKEQIQTSESWNYALGLRQKIGGMKFG